MNQERYLEEVRRQLSSYYQQLKAGHKPVAEQRSRIEGFMQAGIYMGIYSAPQRDALIAEVHEQIFGMSLRERQKVHQHQWQGDIRDYSEYDSPTINRRSSR
ncbi:hypothetical protein [Parendozoicomonas haliclonae]|uniref:Uncharacterized protein n=1 Tax=Parendozoicomonas haliclonae TaxID=1960125 RepID=A0A1X7APN4_9GAMM|nr:hypothetical protein [Parendozoicomonas haliclonae]SMA50060.1 hypothetical protein EHSB41UT_03851 [Parendozoicomonas haliclonae]